MKRHQVIIVTALAFYVTALAVFWTVATRDALERTQTLIGRSERDFEASICGAVDTVLLHSCYELINELGDRLLKADNATLQEYGRLFLIDEINVVDSNGVNVASTIPGIVGNNFADNPRTAEFLTLLHGEINYSQDFRPGIHNPEAFRKYFGMRLPGRKGFIQLGLDFERIGRSLYNLDRRQLREWLFGRYGYFDLYDNDGDGVCDYGAAVADGEIKTAVVNGETVFVRPFTYSEKRFIAVLPEREYFGERNVNFMIFAPSLAVLVLVLAYFVLSMTRAAERERRHQAVMAAARERDLSMAKAIQLSVLPNLDRYRKAVFTASLGARTVPAKVVGGDFYDFYFIDTTHLAVIVADVAGKGIPAAMFMMRAKNVLFNALCAEHDVVAAVAAANARLCENNEAEMFVTAWVGLLDVHSGELEYVNAGHNRPFVVRADGRVEKVMGRGGLFLAAFPTAKYRSDHLVLRRDDFLFLFSDGVTEAMDSRRRTYGEERLRQVLGGCRPDPQAVIEDVAKSLTEHVGDAEQSDDLTAVTLVWHGAPERQARSFVAADASLGEAMDWLRETVGLQDRKAKARLLNAADEMMTNIVSYSGAKEFTMVVENAPGRSRLTFVDAGREYNPLSHIDPDTHLPLAERPEGGLGILMTKRLVDAVQYTREEGRNLLVLVKLDE